jgi:hypothetical protein
VPGSPASIVTSGTEDAAVAWSAFAEAAPELAAFGRQRLEGRVAYLSTVRADGSPRLHPVSLLFRGGRLLFYMEPQSPKVGDVRRDPRCAIHCAVEDDGGGAGEFAARARAEEVADPGVRAAAWDEAVRRGYHPRPERLLFELRIGTAMATVYDEGRPKRTRWRAASQTDR